MYSAVIMTVSKNVSKLSDSLTCSIVLSIPMAEWTADKHNLFQHSSGHKTRTMTVYIMT